jgi:hypothetical protein
MERVTGIGGVFFRAKDPRALAHWYRDHLGIDSADGPTVWEQQQGPTIFSPVDGDATLCAPDSAFRATAARTERHTEQRLIDVA